MAPIKHGQGGKIRSPLYKVWCAMNSRCRDPGRPDYIHYGGRGISIHWAWEDFGIFERHVLDEIGAHPGKGWTFDRTRNNGNYEPGNIRWATQKTQCRNQRRVRLTVETTQAIRAAYAKGGVSYSGLARTYAVSKPTIAKVITGRTWL